MKNNQLTAMLVGLLFLSTLGSVALMYQYNNAYRNGQRMEPVLKEIGDVEKVMNLLSADTVEYNRVAKNPDMTRLLQSFSAPRTAAKPAATK